MDAIILAAGRGERMRPLTDVTPKALLEAGGKPLIVWHIEKLAAAGFKRIVINLAHLGAQIEALLGSGSPFGVEIAYSREARALDTGGGIAYALPLLGSTSFAVVNADVFCDYDYAALARSVTRLAEPGFVAHLVLVNNRDHHPEGDFALENDQVILQGSRLTFSGIGAYRDEMFAEIARGAVAPLAPLLRGQIKLNRVSGEHYQGRWSDVGTPQRLRDLNRELASL
jgi:MurNAc alpha-1-phosphate uridylyltransferase